MIGYSGDNFTGTSWTFTLDDSGLDFLGCDWHYSAHDDRHRRPARPVHSGSADRLVTAATAQEHRGSGYEASDS